MLKVQNYTGKIQGDRQEKNQGLKLDLASDIRDRNVTLDNFFISYYFGQAIFRGQINIVGTKCKNKRVTDTNDR